MKKHILNFFIIIFAGVFIFSGSMLLKSFLENKKNASEYNELTELIKTKSVPVNADTDTSYAPDTSTETAEEASEVTELTAAESYEELYAKNNDFIGWIRIDGTDINYPVMQTKDRPDYYLRRNFYGNYSDFGVPYMAEHCTVGESDNLIIYGHHLHIGTMFTSLMKYTSKAFFDEHRIVNFDTMQEYGTYTIIAVFKETVYESNTFQYYNFVKFGDETEFDNFVNKCQSLSLYNTGETAKFGDQLLTLSTCEYSSENGRLVVIAKKIA